MRRIPKELSFDTEGFAAKVQIPVHWGDQDAFSHLNNVKYLRYFETARVQYLAETKWLEKQQGVLRIAPIVKSVACTYLKPVVFPSTLTLWTSTMEKKSKGCTVGTVFENGGEIMAVAKAVVISFDYEANKPCEIPEHVSKYIEEVEKTVPNWVKERLAATKF